MHKTADEETAGYRLPSTPVLSVERHACGRCTVGCDVHTSKCKSGKTLDSGRVQQGHAWF